MTVDTGGPGEIYEGVVIAHDYEVAVCRMEASYRYAYDGFVAKAFMPAKTPEDRAVEAMADAMRGTEVASTVRAQKINADAIYRAIRDGKIPGVTITEEPDQ